MFGAGMAFIGANWFMMESSDGNAAVGILVAFDILGGLVVFPFGGTIADRFIRKHVILWLNSVRAVITLAIAIIYYIHGFELSLILLWGFISGMGWMIYFSSSRGLMQEILDKDSLIEGNSFIEITMQVGMFAAGALAGFIYKFTGFTTILVINAAMYIVSSIFIAMIRYTPTISSDRGSSFVGQFKNGLSYLKGNPVLFLFGIAMFLPFVATFASNVVAPGYVSERLHADSIVFGLADMSYSIGACLSGFIAASVASRVGSSKAVIAFFIISFTSFSYLVVNESVAIFYAAIFICGLGNSSLRIIMNTLAMERVPKELMGRSMAVWNAISMSMQIASCYGVGILMDRTQAAYGYIWMAAIMFVGLIACSILVPKLIKDTFSG